MLLTLALWTLAALLVVAMATARRKAGASVNYSSLDLRRVWVVGSSGAGKSFFSDALATTLNRANPAEPTTMVDLDDYFWGAGWVRRSTDEVKRQLMPTIASPGARCIIAGNYHAELGTTLMPRVATTIVWVHPPRRQVILQLAWRCLLRTALPAWLGKLLGEGSTCCNGNRESAWVQFFTKRSIIYRTWQAISAVEARYREFRASPPAEFSGQFVELQSRSEIACFLAAATTPPLAKQQAQVV